MMSKEREKQEKCLTKFAAKYLHFSTTQLYLTEVIIVESKFQFGYATTFPTILKCM